MEKTYRPYEPDQLFLLPPALQDWVPEGHLVHFISDVVDQLDLSPIVVGYEQEARGYPPVSVAGLGEGPGRMGGDVPDTELAHAVSAWPRMPA